MMNIRWLGHALLWVGFLAGGLIAVRNTEVAGDKWATIEWHWYAVSLVVGIAGVLILRATKRGEQGTSHRIDQDLGTLSATSARLVEKLARLDSMREEIDVFEVHEKIDAELADDLRDFADARESILHRYGVEPYAKVMSEFAAGERSIHRAWSASADGYIDEVWTSVERASEQMQTASRFLSEIQRSAHA